MSARGCTNDPNTFCYICGKYMLCKQRLNITPFVKEAYRAYFGLVLGDENKPWAPQKVCKTCVEGLRLWMKGQREKFYFALPMVWREQLNHTDDCYFCQVKVQGFSAKNKSDIVYPHLRSAMRPIKHDESLPIPSRPSSSCTSPTKEVSYTTDISGSDTDEFAPSTGDNTPRLFSQSALNDLVRDLALPKESAELLASVLKDRHLLLPGTKISCYRFREQEIVSLFSEARSMIFCNDIPKLVTWLGVTYVPSEWRLFIDSSVTSLKGVLLHNGNVLGSVPVAYSSTLKESYESLQFLLQCVKYSEHGWHLCGDFKVINLLLGLQMGYTKMPCFLCEWDSRDRQNHWQRREWPTRGPLTPGTKNVLHVPLVEPTKVLLPPLHIKLGIMSQFVRALDKDSECFKYICGVYHKMTLDKLKAGVFTGPQIRKLMCDPNFEDTMSQTEKQAWHSYKDVVQKFLGNERSPDYKNIVNSMLEKLRKLGCNMSLKLHFLHAHIDYFPERSLGFYSEEQGERFHQDLKDIERRYHGGWTVNMMADYCWSLKRESTSQEYGRRAKRRKFLPVK